MNSLKIKKHLKKSALMFGIATSMAVASACTYTPNNEQESESIQSTLSDGTLDIQKTEEYYLVRIDGNTYLCTKHIEQDIYNDINQFFNVENGEFVGQTLEPNALSRINNHIYGEFPIRLTNYRKDGVYFDGCYGYQKNLPFESITPLTEFVVSDYPSLEEFQFFSSNSQELQEFFEKTRLFETSSIKTYVYKDNKSKGTVVYYYNKLLHCICSDKEGEKKEFVGYHCSPFVKDVGFQYMYDLVSGKIIYVGNHVSDYENFQSDEIYYENSILSCKEKFNLLEETDPQIDSSMDVQVNEQNLMNEYDIFVLDVKKLFEDFGIDENVTKDNYNYSNDSDTFVFVSSGQTYEDYYYFQKDDHSFDDGEIYYYCSKKDSSLADETYDYYDDILHPYEISSTQRYNKNNGQSSIYFKCGITLSYYDKLYFSPYMMPINRFLESKGLEDLKQDKYTAEDISNINIYLTSKEVTRTREK